MAQMVPARIGQAEAASFDQIVPNQHTSNSNNSNNFFSSVAKNFLSSPQQSILADLVSFKRNYQKIHFHDPNYTQLRAWGKTRLCLAMCLYDALTAQNRPIPWYVVITDSPASSALWAREWSNYVDYCQKYNCSGEKKSNLSLDMLTTCRTIASVDEWIRLSLAAKMMRVLVISRDLFSNSCKAISDFQNIAWTICFLDASASKDLRVRTYCYFVVKSSPSPSTDEQEGEEDTWFDRILASLTDPIQDYSTLPSTLPISPISSISTRSATTGYNLDRRYPGYFQYDPTPHLLVYLRHNDTIRNKSIVIKKIPNNVVTKRAELNELASRLQIRLGSPIIFSSGPDTEVEKTENIDNNNDAEACLVCYTNLATCRVKLSCCSASDLCVQCFYKYFFVSLGKNTCLKCIFCTKTCLYTVIGQRDMKRTRLSIPLPNQISTMRLFYELNEAITDNNAESGFLVVIHKSIVQKYFGSGKRFNESLGKFNNDEPVQMLKDGGDEPVFNLCAFAFVYEFVDDVVRFFARKKMPQLRLIAHVRGVRDPYHIEEDLFETLNATRIRNSRLTIVKIFIE